MAQSRPTTRSTRFWDRFWGAVVTVGGLGVIVAVLGIFVYLLATVLPLFRPGHTEPAARVDLRGTEDGWEIQADEYLGLAAVLTRGGELRLVHVPTRTEVRSERLCPEGTAPTALSLDHATGMFAMGFGDGSIRLGRLGFKVENIRGDDAAAPPTSAPDRLVWPEGPGEGMWPGEAQRIGGGGWRISTPEFEIREAIVPEGKSSSVVAIDYRRRADLDLLVVLRADGTAELDHVRTVRPLGGGKPRVRLSTFPLPFEAPAGRGQPVRVLAASDGGSVVFLWDDGFAQRYATADPGTRPIVLAETTTVLEAGRRVTASGVLLGGLSLLVGDDSGRVSVVFAAYDLAARTPDHLRLVRAATFRASEKRIEHLALSPRDRSFLAADADGALAVINATSGKVVARASGERAAAVAIAPKMDALLALDSRGGLSVHALEAGHPEASARSLFEPVWYEGLPGPAHVYQSSSGDDAAEAKLGLVPLILGTLKATVFSMLFALPVAVLAAIFTSEFLHPKVRGKVKPAIELMASVPSVVLGFIAAVIVAPFLRDRVPALLAAFAVVPTVVLLGAHAWQGLSPRVAARVGSSVRVVLIAGAVALGAVVSTWIGPRAEAVLFRPTASERLVMAGHVEAVAESERPGWLGGRDALGPDDQRRLRAQGLYLHEGRLVRPAVATEAERRAIDADLGARGLVGASFLRWLDGNIGGAWPGWFVVSLLPAAGVVFVAQARVLGRVLNHRLSRMSRMGAAAADLARTLACLAGSVALAAVMAEGLTRAGLDARDFVFGPYSQRNTLVVGLIMGFAVIPIIYTIAEDAMSSVPASLRSASLGAGATPWQTAVRVVLPVAASGIFSAAMIGLGRAVGETMIVVMATGNTPSMDWNVFSGFRTLSANIAVELPEAPKDSTHYRVLFLCGLVLFGLTFVINTTAEVCRQYFRRRNAAL